MEAVPGPRSFFLENALSCSDVSCVDKRKRRRDIAASNNILKAVGYVVHNLQTLHVNRCGVGYVVRCRNILVAGKIYPQQPSFVSW